MNARRWVVAALGVSLLAVGEATAGPLGHAVAAAVREAGLGCRPRLRRCVTVVRVPVVPVMPRAEEVSLRFRFDKAPAYFAEITTETKQTMRVMGQEVVQTQLQKFLLRCTTEGMNEKGEGLLGIKIVGIAMNLDIGGVRIVVCGPGAGKPAGDPVSDLFRMMEGAELRFMIDPSDMSVQAIEGHEELIRKLSNTPAQMAPLVSSLVNKDALTRMVAPLFDFAPLRALRPGDTWERQDVTNLGPIGNYRTRTHNRYVGKSGAYEKIVTRRTLHYEAPKEPGGLPFTIRKAELKSTSGDGVTLFEARRDRLVSADFEYVLEGKLTIDVGGMETDVELRQTQVSRVRVTDEKPRGWQR